MINASVAIDRSIIVRCVNLLGSVEAHENTNYCACAVAVDRFSRLFAISLDAQTIDPPFLADEKLFPVFLRSIPAKLHPAVQIHLAKRSPSYTEKKKHRYFDCTGKLHKGIYKQTVSFERYSSGCNEISSYSIQLINCYYFI